MKLGPIWEFTVLQADWTSPLTECLWALCLISGHLLCAAFLWLSTHKKYPKCSDSSQSGIYSHDCQLSAEASTSSALPQDPLWASWASALIPTYSLRSLPADAWQQKHIDHQLTTSPAHQLTGSPAHRLTSSLPHQITSSPDHQITSSLAVCSDWLIPMHSPFLDPVTNDHQTWDAQIFLRSCLHERIYDYRYRIRNTTFPN